MIGDGARYDLKNASLVSREWRIMCFRWLFRFIRWVPAIDQADPSKDPPLYDMEAFLKTPKVLFGSVKFGEIVEGLSVMAVKSLPEHRLQSCRHESFTRQE